MLQQLVKNLDVPFDNYLTQDSTISYHLSFRAQVYGSSLRCPRFASSEGSSLRCPRFDASGGSSLGCSRFDASEGSSLRCPRFGASEGSSLRYPRSIRAKDHRLKVMAGEVGQYE